MKLSLETRDVGRVTIVRCKGRLIAGEESDALRSHLSWLLRDRRAIILHLAELAFVDSSGLGTMVRGLTSTRQVHGDLKLCDIPEHVAKVLRLSHLTKLFDCHDSEDSAVAAFYKTPPRADQAVSASHSILCVGRNTDVMAYIRESLRRKGFDVHTSNNLRDSQILMRVTKFHLLLVEAGIAAAPATEQSFRALCAGVPIIELGTEFSTLEAGEATAGLLAKISAHLPTQLDSAS
jgi:anti-sigma B factor antagonist